MSVHMNAGPTAHSRADLVRRVLGEGQSAMAVATASGLDAGIGEDASSTPTPWTTST